MIHRTDKILIGKDISRDAQVVAGAGIKTLVASSSIADGELVVLDKYKKVLAAGATIADSDTIYICQGTSETFDFTNEAGTTTTTNRKVIFSDPIQGQHVRTYSAVPYTVKAEETATIDITGMVPVVGTEYIVRIIYKDIKEHPGQFTQTYRYISTTATLDTFGAAIAAKINAHSGRRVNATYTSGTDALLLTAREISECCTALTDIDEFSMVEFEVFFNYADANGNWQSWVMTDDTITYTGPTYGNGNWEQIRDMEKRMLGYVGPLNRTHFPVLEPTMRTVVDSTYHQIIIEHDVEYRAPNNQGYELTPVTTVIACVVPSSGTQLASLLMQLNTWMNSTPKAFESLTFAV